MEQTMTQRFLRAAMLLPVTMLTAVTVWADNVTYIDANGTVQTVDATAVTEATTVMGTSGSTTWYYVSGTVENDNRIELAGTVNLILENGCDFKANHGLHLASGNTLNVYVQSALNGKLYVVNNNHDAAIGGNGGEDGENGTNGQDGGNVNIYGGVIEINGTLGGGNGGYGQGVYLRTDQDSQWVDDDWDEYGNPISQHEVFIDTDIYEGGTGGRGGNSGTICIYGGQVYIYGSDAAIGGGYGGWGNETTGSNGSGNVDLSWKNATDYVYIPYYNGTVTLQKPFTDEEHHVYAVGVHDDIDNVKLLPTTAAVEYHAEAAPTCTEVGYTQNCWYNYLTEKYYTDEACTQAHEIAASAVVIPALGHNIEHHAAQSATFTTAGNLEYWQCDRCDKYFGDANGENEFGVNDVSALFYSVEGNATDGYSIRIPKTGTHTLTLDNSVTSFKIYDEGGEGGSTTDDDQPGNYSNNCDGRLVLIAPENHSILLTGDVMTESGNYDYLTVYRGTTADDNNILLNRKYSDTPDVASSIGSLIATSMLLYFYSDGGVNRAGLDLTATLLNGEYENAVFYVDANGEEQFVDATQVTSETTTMGTAGQTTWYYVSGNVENDNRIELSGTVNLILADGCTLTANYGLHLPAGNTLNIFTQSTGSGKLNASYEGNNAAIGGDGGDDDNNGEDAGVVNIYGGKVDCNGTMGGGDGKSNGTATINLLWTNAEDVIYANPYNGTVTLLKAFTDENCNNYAVGAVTDNANICRVYLLSTNAVVYHAQAAATCTETGYTQDCWFKYATNKYYADEACTEELDADEVVIPSTGHNMTHTDGTAATFTTPGSIDYWYCDRCQNYFCDEEGNSVINNFDLSDVAFAVEGNATDGYYVRMPKFGTGTLNIDNTVASFKIYDDGGEGGSETESGQTGNYSDNCEGHLVLIAPDNKQVKLTGTVLTEGGCDYLAVYNGTTTNGSKLLYDISSDWDSDNGYPKSAVDIGTIVAPSMTLNFHSDVSKNYTGLDLTATIEDETGVILGVDNKGKTMAILDGSSNVEVKIESNITVQNVNLNRSFTAGQPSTLMLPFDIDVDHATGAAFYTFTGVDFDNDENKWKATMTEVEAGYGNSIQANTPCLVVPNDSELKFPGSHTLNTKTGGSKETIQGDWTFKGTYAEKTWTAGECGNDYGFAATSGKAVDGVTDVEAGDFVQIAEGAHIRPMRSYLNFTGSGNPFAGAPRRAAEELPQRISVILVKADGSTTEIGTITPTVSEEGVWFSLDGVKLNGKPTAKGLYINNGKKVVVK